MSGRRHAAATRGIDLQTKRRVVVHLEPDGHKDALAPVELGRSTPLYIHALGYDIGARERQSGAHVLRELLVFIRQAQREQGRDRKVCRQSELPARIDHIAGFGLGAARRDQIDSRVERILEVKVVAVIAELEDMLQPRGEAYVARPVMRSRCWKTA